MNFHLKLPNNYLYNQLLLNEGKRHEVSRWICLEFLHLVPIVMGPRLGLGLAQSSPKKGPGPIQAWAQRFDKSPENWSLLVDECSKN